MLVSDFGIIVASAIWSVALVLVVLIAAVAAGAGKDGRR